MHLTYFEMMVMYDYCEAPTSQVITTVIVKNPIIHHTYDDKRYTSYEISFKSNDTCFSFASSSVRRRFSDFVLLRKLLQFQHPTINPPPLPSRNLFRNRFSVDFIEQRGKQLENFLQQILATPLYLSNKTFHLFLQSSLLMTEIEAQVSGKLPVVSLEKIESHNLITGASLSHQTSADVQCQTCEFVEGKSSNGSRSTSSNSTSINHDMQVPSLPVLQYTIDRHIITERAHSFRHPGINSKEVSPCSSLHSTCSLP